MKRTILNLLLLAFPLLIFAQQKEMASPDQLKSEMKQLQEDLQLQMKALQDSISKLHIELDQRDEKRMKSWDWSFHYNSPQDFYSVPAVPPIPPLPEMHGLDSLLDKGFGKNGDWDFGFEMPVVPSQPPLPPPHILDYDLHIPHFDNQWFHVEPHDWHFDLKAPGSPMKKHHHYEDLLESLPFYNLFKS